MVQTSTRRRYKFEVRDSRDNYLGGYSHESQQEVLRYVRQEYGGGGQFSVQEMADMANGVVISKGRNGYTFSLSTEPVNANL